MSTPLLDDQDEFDDPAEFRLQHPGTGKGDLIRESFENVVEMRMSVIDIADIRGLPTVPHKGGSDALR